MPEPFRPFERMVRITVLGKTFEVPEKNSLLRCFQYLSPETIPYGRFCWNQECQYCRVECQLPDDDESREMISCKFLVMEGMNVTRLSPELKRCLRAVLKTAPAAAPSAVSVPKPGLVGPAKAGSSGSPPASTNGHKHTRARSAIASSRKR